MSVYKVERKSVVMEVELSTGKKGELRFFLPSTKQTGEILKAGETGATASFDINIDILKANTEGELKDAFIADIMENGDANEFIQAVQAEAAKQKKTR
jgi:hypothetical protein